MTEIRSLDPVTFEVINNGLGSLADEMAFIITRTAHSEIVREVLDFSTAIATPDGTVVAQGLLAPLHMFVISHTMVHVLREFGDAMEPGDVFIVNDPYAGGTHLPDFTVVRPAFHDDGTLLGFAATVAHQTDVGGRVAGGNAADSREVYAEGLRIPPSVIVRRGVEDKTLLRIIAANVRTPERVLGDISSQIAATAVGAEGLRELAARYEPDRLFEYMDALLDHSERLTRSEITTLPDGTYRFVDHIDTDAFGSGPLPIEVAVTVAGDELSIDFTGTASQVRGAINCVLAFTRSAACSAVRCAFRRDIPYNDGFMRPIHVKAPDGSLLNPRPPAAVAARALTAYRVADATFGALAQAAPERVMAAGEGGNTVVCIGGYDDNRTPFILVDMVNGSWGGRASRDGIEGVTNPTQNLNTTPIEVIERELPIRIRTWGFVPDTEGPGKYRGGLALRREYEFLGNEAVLQVRSDRRDFPPYGLLGGHPGAPSQSVLNPGERGERTLTQTVTMDIRRGDVLRHDLPGAGGFGAPVERDPAAVAADVRAGKVNRVRAREIYQVELAPDGSVDAEATMALRGGRQQEEVWE